MKYILIASFAVLFLIGDKTTANLSEQSYRSGSSAVGVSNQQAKTSFNQGLGLPSGQILWTLQPIANSRNRYNSSVQKSVTFPYHTVNIAHQTSRTSKQPYIGGSHNSFIEDQNVGANKLSNTGQQVPVFYSPVLPSGQEAISINRQVSRAAQQGTVKYPLGGQQSGRFSTPAFFDVQRTYGLPNQSPIGSHEVDRQPAFLSSQGNIVGSSGVRLLNRYSIVRKYNLGSYSQAPSAGVPQPARPPTQGFSGIQQIAGLSVVASPSKFFTTGEQIPGSYNQLLPSNQQGITALNQISEQSNCLPTTNQGFISNDKASALPSQVSVINQETANSRCEGNIAKSSAVWISNPASPTGQQSTALCNQVSTASDQAATAPKLVLSSDPTITPSRTAVGQQDVRPYPDEENVAAGKQDASFPNKMFGYDPPSLALSSLLYLIGQSAINLASAEYIHNRVHSPGQPMAELSSPLFSPDQKDATLTDHILKPEQPAISAAERPKEKLTKQDAVADQHTIAGSPNKVISADQETACQCNKNIVVNLTALSLPDHVVESGQQANVSLKQVYVDNQPVTAQSSQPLPVKQLTTVLPNQSIATEQPDASALNQVMATDQSDVDLTSVSADDSAAAGLFDQNVVVIQEDTGISNQNIGADTPASTVTNKVFVPDSPLADKNSQIILNDLPEAELTTKPITTNSPETSLIAPLDDGLSNKVLTNDPLDTDLTNQSITTEPPGADLTTEITDIAPLAVQPNNQTLPAGEKVKEDKADKDLFGIRSLFKMLG